MTAPNGSDEVRSWLQDFERCVNALDFEGGRTMFREDCVCFGSKAELLVGLDDLVERQWKAIWPNISGFRFLTEGLNCEFSVTGHTVCVIVQWTSTGYHRDGVSYDRSGRATLLLSRCDERSVWLARHSHYSLNPGTPGGTFAVGKK